MEAHPQKYDTSPIEDLQLLAQFKIRKQVQIQLVRLKQDVYKSVNLNSKPRSSHNKPNSIQNRPHYNYATQPFKCNLCKYSGTKQIYLTAHLKRHSVERPFKCNLCSYKGLTRNYLNKHIATHTREKPYQCLQCDYSAAVKAQLKSHIKYRHSNDIRLKSFPCNLCLRIFHSKSNLYTHILRHTGETLFVCQFCERKFNMHGNKTRHEKICKTNPKQKDINWVQEQMFKCELCQYLFTDKSNLKRHLAIHTGSKQFSCSQCSFRSANSFNLKRHFQRHSKDQQPLKC